MAKHDALATVKSLKKPLRCRQLAPLALRAIGDRLSTVIYKSGWIDFGLDGRWTRSSPLALTLGSLAVRMMRSRNLKMHGTIGFV
jgi:hypothetical protein